MLLALALPSHIVSRELQTRRVREANTEAHSTVSTGVAADLRSSRWLPAPACGLGASCDESHTCPSKEAIDAWDSCPAGWFEITRHEAPDMGNCQVGTEPLFTNSTSPRLPLRSIPLAPPKPHTPHRHAHT